MKKLNKFILGLMSVTALLFSACSDDVPSDDFGASPAIPGEGVYFAKSIPVTVSLKGTSGTFTLSVQRTYTDNAATVEVKVELGTGAAGVLDVPSTLAFAAGEKGANLQITYQNAVQGTPYILKISFPDGTEYGYSTQTFKVEYPFPEIWEPISTNAVYIDQYYSKVFTTASDVVFTNVTVERLKDKNKYRFRSPYDNKYLSDYIFGEEVKILPDDFVLPYIILDGESYSKPEEGKEDEPIAMEKAVYAIPRTYLGFVFDYNAMSFDYDSDWLAFGSFPYTLVPEDDKDFAKYKAGSFNKKKQMFDLGTCLCNIKSVGGLDVDGFQLWLDPTKMEVVYDRDYEWNPLPEATGTFTSELTGDKWTQDVEIAEVEEGEAQLYHFTSLYEDGVNIVFSYDKAKGTLRMPKKQKTGLTSFGNDVYVDMASGSVKDNTFTFQLVFYLVGEDGKKSAELKRTTEIFTWGKIAPDPLDALEKGHAIEDYCGAWSTQFVDISGEDPDPYDSNITISKVSANVVAVNGLAPIAAQYGGYDDTVVMEYDQNTKLLTFKPQKVNAFQGYDFTAMPFNFMTSKLGAKSTLVAGLVDGKFTLMNPSSNSAQYNSIGFFDSEGYILDTYIVVDFTWEKAITNKSVRSVSKMSIMKPTARKALTPVWYRSYNNDLRITPTQEKKATGLMIKKITSSKKFASIPALD